MLLISKFIYGMVSFQAFVEIFNTFIFGKTWDSTAGYWGRLKHDKPIPCGVYLMILIVMISNFIFCAYLLIHIVSILSKGIYQDPLRMRKPKMIRIMTLPEEVNVKL